MILGRWGLVGLGADHEESRFRRGGKKKDVFQLRGLTCLPARRQLTTRGNFEKRKMKRKGGRKRSSGSRKKKTGREAKKKIPDLKEVVPRALSD